MRSAINLFLVCWFSILFSSAYSQLHWVNPVPQGNPIKSVCFTDDESGFLAGDAGTLLRSGDNGQTWSIIDSVTVNNLSSVHFINAQTGLLAGDSGLILKSTDAGFSWNKMESSTNKPINDIYFIDSLTAITMGNQGEITKTIDGGNSWYEVASPTFLHLWSVTFPEDSIGYAVGGDKGFKGVILKTIDKGESWDTLSTQFEGHLYTVWFFDSLRGYAAGNNSKIYKTISGGQIWAPLNNLNQGNNHHIRDMVFSDFNTGYTVDIHGNIQRTLNAGATWDSLSSHTTTALYTISINGDGIIYSGGLGGKILRSVDQGLNWHSVSYGSQINLVSIDFPVSTTGFITGAGGMFKTTNGGQQWDYSEATELTYAVDAHFLDAETGFVLDVDGAIYKTSDAGESWTVQNTGEKSQSYNAIFMVNTTLGFAVGGGHSSNNSWSLAIKTNDGENWGNMPLAAGEPLHDVCFINASEGFVCGEFGTLMQTSNGGNTWHSITMDTTYALVDMDFLTKDIGFLVGNKPNSSKVFKTTNGGSSWQEFFHPQDLKQNEKINAVRFADEVNGFAIGTNGLIYKTINGGDTWFRVSKITNNPLNDIYPRGGFDGFIAGTGGTILRMEPVVGIEPLTDEQNSPFKIFPNPASDRTTMVFPASNDGPTKIAIMDIQGRVIDLLLDARLSNGMHQLRWDTQSYPNGIYIVSISSNSYLWAEKLIIQH